MSRWWMFVCRVYKQVTEMQSYNMPEIATKIKIVFPLFWIPGSRKRIRTAPPFENENFANSVSTGIFVWYARFQCR